MAIDETGRFSGSVSGGCIEGAVVAAARDGLETGRPVLLAFGVTNDMAWEVGLACGGRVEVFVAPIDAESGALLRTVQARRSEKVPCAVVTDLASGEAAAVDVDSVTGPLSLNAAQVAAVRQRIDADRSGRTEDGLFVRVHAPPARLIVVGAVHIARALVPMAALAGFQVAVIEPREAFVRSSAMDAAVVAAWPDEGVAALRPDARTAVVTLTHDPKLDDPALATALRSRAFYIGALGSRKTHAARLARLKAAGFADEDLARIHGPIGLAINALTPAEIAVSIMAQVVQSLRTGGA